MFLYFCFIRGKIKNGFSFENLDFTPFLNGEHLKKWLKIFSR